MTLLQLFLSFVQIGLFSVGGGYAAIPLIRQQVVEVHAWLTPQTFLDLTTIAEMTPGPIAINAATFVGLHIAGMPGALTATFACILPSLIIVSLISWLYTRYRTLSLLQETLSMMRACVVALIASAGLTMLMDVSGLPEAPFLPGLLLSLGAFALLRAVKLSPILVLLICGAAGALLGVAGVF